MTKATCCKRLRARGFVHDSCAWSEEVYAYLPRRWETGPRIVFGVPHDYSNHGDVLDWGTACRRLVEWVEQHFAEVKP